ncbi:MAG: phosphate/phosphite/phosphonate ABC transporter substrate-binding protein [Acidimicrobiales bacterium]
MSTTPKDSFVLGAVAYAPKVVTIWEGFRDWFAAHDFPFDYVLYSNYERQVEDLLAGRIDAAWNSPLAWVRARRLAAAAGRSASAPIMRDTDQDLTSVVLVRSDGTVGALSDLAGRRVAVGATDSPQSRLIPLGHLAAAGLAPGRDLDVVGFDVMVGKHGDHVGGERDAVTALLAGDVDAACVIGANQLTFAQEGLIVPGSLRVLSETEPYDHCVFTVVDDATDAATVDVFGELLLSMSFDDSDVRGLLELEGLRQWRRGRTSGFDQLERAVDLLQLYDEAGRIIDPTYHP